MEYAGSKILVTGGAGFIGGCLVERLVKVGAQVTVVDDLSSASARPLAESVRFVRMQLPDPTFPDLVSKGQFDGIFHLAGASYVPPSVEDPFTDLRNNAEVTLQVLESVRRKSSQTRLVYTSSAAVYGNPVSLPIREDDPTTPVSPYGISKRSAEGYVSLYAPLHSLKTASLRLFSVFGPGQRKQVIFDLMDRLYQNPSELMVYGTGQESRDFVYQADVVQAALLVMSRGRLGGEVYNVASGSDATIAELVQIICRISGFTPKINFTGQVRPGDALKWSADISRLKALGYTPSHTLAQGVVSVHDWYLEQSSRAKA